MRSRADPDKWKRVLPNLAFCDTSLTRTPRHLPLQNNILVWKQFPYSSTTLTMHTLGITSEYLAKHSWSGILAFFSLLTGAKL